MSAAKKTALVIISALMGLGFAIHIYGIDRLNPLNYGWLMVGDAATHFLGWHFYRGEPLQFPLGLIERYGMEASSSIVYTDSIPLFALILKPFSVYLPDVMQYTGIWIAFSYMLQGALGALLVARFTPNPLLILLGSSFFILSSIMAFRGSGHYALMGHWLILAAFLLYRIPRLPWAGLSWGALAGIAVLVHAYLAVMVLAVFAADFASRILRRTPEKWGTLILQAGLVLAIAGGCMWIAGYFTAGSVSGGGSTLYSMNMLAPLMPTPGGEAGFVPHHPPATWGQYEGYNFLGLGTLLLLLLALPRLRSLYHDERERFRLLLPLAVVICLMALYALSPMVTLGPYTLLHVPPLTVVADVFRATGRLFWPAFYLLTLLALFFTVRYRKAWVAAPILAVALAAQWADLSPLYKHRVMDQPFSQAYVSPLVSEFWSNAADRYDYVIVIPPTFTPEDFIPLSHYAAMNGMAINIAYYGRQPSHEAQYRRQERIDRLMNGVIDPRALYVFRSSSDLTDLISSLDETDSYGLIDDHWVLAPGALAHGLRENAHTRRRH